MLYFPRTGLCTFVILIFVLQKVCMKTGTDTGFEVSLKDVYEEFSKKVVDKYKIAKFKSKVE